jgi:hypothetical protein
MAHEINSGTSGLTESGISGVSSIGTGGDGGVGGTRTAPLMNVWPGIGGGIGGSGTGGTSLPEPAGFESVACVLVVVPIFLVTPKNSSVFHRPHPHSAMPLHSSLLEEAIWSYWLQHPSLLICTVEYANTLYCARDGCGRKFTDVMVSLSEKNWGGLYCKVRPADLSLMKPY